jgi:hypothetical protein
MSKTMRIGGTPHAAREMERHREIEMMRAAQTQARGGLLGAARDTTARSFDPRQWERAQSFRYRINLNLRWLMGFR